MRNDELVVYPVLIKKDGEDYLVCIPDLTLYTEGKSFPDAMAMARDAIGSQLLALEDEGQTIPKASDGNDAIEIAKANADDDEFCYSDGVLTFVDVDVEAFKAKRNNRAVKKNCTIPFWLNEKAEAMGVNFSRVLQDALVRIVAE